MTMTAGSVFNNDAMVTWAPPDPPKERLTEGLIRCAVKNENELILIPLTDLGASILARLMHGEKQWAGLFAGGPAAEMRWGKGLERVEITQRTSPMLSTGDDPFYTGQTITPEEAKACRAWLEHRRKRKKP